MILVTYNAYVDETQGYQRVAIIPSDLSLEFLNLLDLPLLRWKVDRVLYLRNTCGG